jgi:hypothetical protein
MVMYGDMTRRLMGAPGAGTTESSGYDILTFFSIKMICGDRDLIITFYCRTFATEV